MRRHAHSARETRDAAPHAAAERDCADADEAARARYRQPSPFGLILIALFTTVRHFKRMHRSPYRAQIRFYAFTRITIDCAQHARITGRISAAAAMRGDSLFLFLLFALAHLCATAVSFAAPIAISLVPGMARRWLRRRWRRCRIRLLA